MGISPVQRRRSTPVSKHRTAGTPRKRRASPDTFEPARSRRARRKDVTAAQVAADVPVKAAAHPRNVDLVKQTADRYGVPRDLALAVAYHESKFDEKAGSPTGVKGVMQVTRRTAAGMGLDRDNNEQNIEAGMRKLKYAVDRADSDRDYAALARYYNGSSAAQQANWAREVELARRVTGRM